MMLKMSDENKEQLALIVIFVIVSIMKHWMGMPEQFESFWLFCNFVSGINIGFFIYSIVKNN